MGFSSRYTELRTFAAKIFQTVKDREKFSRFSLTHLCSRLRACGVVSGGLFKDVKERTALKQIRNENVAFRQSYLILNEKFQNW
jgi:hypothetical protein